MSSKSESAVIGGDRPLTPEFMNVLNRQASGMPPAGAVDVTAPVEPGDVLPFLQVAQAAVGRHVNDLRLTLSHVERELEVSSPLSASGQPNAYLAERYNGLRETAERIRAEIESIGSWSDHQMQVWAKEHGYR